MTKQKYEKKLVIDAVGLLDKNEDGKIILIIDGVEYDFIDDIKSSLGTEVHLKFDSIEG